VVYVDPITLGDIVDRLIASTDAMSETKLEWDASHFDDRLLGQHLRDYATLLREADAAVDGTLLAHMADVTAAQKTVHLKRRAQDAAWRLERAAEQCDAIEAAHAQAVQRLTEELSKAQAKITRLQTALDNTNDTLTFLRQCHEGK
jgi:hypothetical protein